MNLDEIKELGRKTNRIIEIETELVQIKRLADHLLEADLGLSISLNVYDANLVAKSGHIQAMLQNAIRSSVPINVGFVGSFQMIGPNTCSINLPERHQWQIFDALTCALRQEQQELNNSIKSETQAQ